MGEEQVMKGWSLSWGILILSVVFNVLGVFAIKLRLNDLGEMKLDSWRNLLGYVILLLKSPWVLMGVILFFIAPFLFTVALSRMELAVAYPAQVGLNFAFLILLGFFVLGEQLTMGKIIGIICILIGIYSLNRAG